MYNLQGREKIHRLATISGLYNEDYVYVESYFKTRQTFFHEGVDFYGTFNVDNPERATPIYSFIHGIVIMAGMMEGYGRTILIKDSNKDVLYLLAHLSKQLVKKGDMVCPGMVVGKVGGSKYANGKIEETGYSPHLHLSVLDCNLVAPEKIIQKDGGAYKWFPKNMYDDADRVKYINPFDHKEYGHIKIYL